MFVPKVTSMGTLTGVEVRIGWDDSEQKEFIKAIRQPLMVQTPLQLVIENLFHRLQAQANFMQDMKVKVTRQAPACAQAFHHAVTTLCRPLPFTSAYSTLLNCAPSFHAGLIRSLHIRMAAQWMALSATVHRPGEPVTLARFCPYLV